MMEEYSFNFVEALELQVADSRELIGVTENTFLIKREC
jgi:hypothetical protein